MAKAIACSKLRLETVALVFAAPGTCCALVIGDEGIGCRVVGDVLVRLSGVCVCCWSGCRVRVSCAFAVRPSIKITASAKTIAASRKTSERRVCVHLPNLKSSERKELSRFSFSLTFNVVLMVSLREAVPVLCQRSPDSSVGAALPVSRIIFWLQKSKDCARRKG